MQANGWKELAVTCILLIIMVSCQYPGGEMPTVEKIDTEETRMSKYTNIKEYHWPDGLKGKTVVNDETGQGYTFGEEGLFQPTSTMLYPNPIKPEVFNSAIDGKTSETVTVTDTGFDYALDMSGKFSYNGKEYFGQVKVDVKKDGDVWLLDDKAARIE